MKTRPFILFTIAIVLLALFGAARADQPPPRQGDANKDADEAAISADGRFVAFSSLASDLVAGDTNYFSDIFVYDRQTEELKIISQARNGGQGNGASIEPSLSADGRFIAYVTGANNLLSDYPHAGGVVVTDLLTGEISRVSRSSDGTPANNSSRAPAISADGRYVAFESSAENLAGTVPPLCNGATFSCYNIYVHDRQTGETTLISQNANGVAGDNHSWRPVISADGRYIAFESDAGNLLEGNPGGPTVTNGQRHVYLYERETGRLSLVAQNAASELADRFSRDPSISGDGRLIAFLSFTLESHEDFGYYVYDRETGATTFVLHIPDGTPSYNFFEPVISADGRTLTFGIGLASLVPGDVNGMQDIFVRDLATGETTLVSRHRNGTLGDDHSWGPAVSGDGQVITFATRATNLGGGAVADTNADIAVHDRATGETSYLTTRPSSGQGNSESRKGAVSADGRFVAFESYASNLAPVDTNGLWDIFVRDMETGRTTLIGRDGPADNQSFAPVISADGRFVVFESLAAAGGTVNWDRNIFAYDRQTGETTLISRPLDTLPAVGGPSQNPTISADGRTIAFDSWANNLVAGDSNDQSDIFIYDSQTGAMTTIPHTIVNDSEWVSPCCAALSADGQYVAFVAWIHYDAVRFGWPPEPYDVSHVYLYNRATGETLMLSYVQRDDYYGESSGEPSISAYGRYVAFHSNVSDLVPDDTNQEADVFVYDRVTAQRELVSRHTNGVQGRYGSVNPSISADGRYVAFQSDADNLVDDDNNHAPDVFIHDRQTGQTMLISGDEDGKVGRGGSVEPLLSPSAEYVVFWSDADLVAGDANGLFDVFLYERPAERISLVSGVILGGHRALAPVVIR